MEKILIIEDDKEISKMLEVFLNQNGYETYVSFDGIDGINKAKTLSVSLILLDLMLPFKSGDELLRQLRKSSSVPVIVMSAKTLTQTKVELLQLGADDYVTKPFDLDELLARINNNVRKYNRYKSSNCEKNTLKYDKIELNINSKEVKICEQKLSLTAKEFALLEILLTNPDKVFSKQNLYESVWNETYAYDDNTINTHISNLRKKIQKISKIDYIETVWGMGYKLIKL